MRPLRFCFFTTFYPPYHFGGDAIGIQRLARGLVKRGHHVTVVHDVDAYESLTDHAPATEPRDGVEIIPVRSGLGVVSPILTQQTGRPIANGRLFKRILEKGRYDVVNYHNASLVGGPGLFRYGRESGAITLYMAHEHWLVCPTHVLWRHGRERCDARECLSCVLSYKRPPQIWRWTGFLEREARHVDAFIAMSEFSRAKHREFGFARDMEVLPYFLPDPESPTPPVADGASPHARPYFFFAGRLERIKGLDDVIPMFRDYADADLVIAGDGDHAAHLRTLAEGLPNVRFLGRLSPDALRQYYQHALALVMPSVCFETFGIVLIESFRQGTPVIARRLGPFPEILEQSRGGELFETRDELIDAMRRVQSDPAHRARLAANGYRAYAERWCESAVVPQYLDIVRRVAIARGDASFETSTSEARLGSRLAPDIPQEVA